MYAVLLLNCSIMVKILFKTELHLIIFLCSGYDHCVLHIMRFAMVQVITYGARYTYIIFTTVNTFVKI